MQNDRLTVSTTGGPVTGVAQPAQAGETGTEAWYGVPYAAPPVGELRFRRPQPVSHRTEPLAATRWGHSPMQQPMPEAMGGVGDSPGTTPDIDEDCLTLNIVRPAGEGREGREDTGDGAASGLPVLVWIYGGAFTVGTSRNYDGRHLAARGDVIVVTVNYRVGPWGFLDFSALSTPGGPVFESNTGLHDQIAALTWIRDNIAAFGGDPANVTVFGESAGGSSVLALMCMPAAQGLFHRVIAESPAVAGTGAASQERWARRFAELLAPDATTDADLGRALLSATQDELLATVGKLAGVSAVEAPGTVLYGPCIDGESLPEPVLRAFAAGRQARVPLIIGTNEHEGLLFLVGAQKSGAEILPVYPDTVRRHLGEKPAVPDLLATYPGFPDPVESARVGGDLLFWYPATVVADAHGAVAPTYSYRFDYVSQDPRFGALGATHGQEIPYVFGRIRAVLAAEGVGATGEVDRDVVFSEQVMDRWLGFARDGIPDAAWPVYRAADRTVQVLDEDCVLQQDPLGERRAAWAAVFGG